MTAHMDWHFRLNRRTASGIKSHSRDWFMTEDDWVKSRDVDTTSAQSKLLT